MKKYKHKITGVEGTVSDGHLYFSRSGVSESLHLSFIENSCDWEEVKEKEYEILSVKYEQNNKIYKLDGGFFKSDVGQMPIHCAEQGNLFEYLKDGYGVFINSVKRLYDNTVYSIGDDIISSPRINGEIVAFEVIEGTMYITTTHSGVGVSLNAVEHNEKAMLVTEDGTYVYKNNHPKLYWVRKDNLLIGSDSRDSLHNANTRDYIYFAEKENVKTYIYENKKRFSLKDVEKALAAPGISNNIRNHVLKKLQE